MHLSLLTLGLATLAIALPADDASEPKCQTKGKTVTIDGEAWTVYCNTGGTGSYYAPTYTQKNYKQCFNYCATTYTNIAAAGFNTDGSGTACLCFTALSQKISATGDYVGVPPGSGTSG